MTRTLRALVATLFLLLCSSCLSPLTRKAKSVLTLPSGTTIDQAGTVETPAHVESQSSKVGFLIPKDSFLSFDPASQKMGLTFARDVQATATATAESGTAAIPTAPLSPVDIARATTLSRFLWVALALALLSGFLFYELHFKAGCVAGVGAVAVPCVARLFGSDAAMMTAGGVVLVAGSLFLAWHFCKGRIFTSATVQEVISKTETAVKSVL
jgi:hypothetical protein